MSVSYKDEDIEECKKLIYKAICYSSFPHEGKSPEEINRLTASVLQDAYSIILCEAQEDK